MSLQCLSHEQTARFYRIWFALLHYVNEQRHLVAPFSATPAEGSVQPADAMQVRNALWADDALREGFIAENPAQLSSTDLTLVASWQYRLAGTFYIVRALKAYTVFLTDHAPMQAYGVVGLSSPLEETVEFPLPVYAQVVLLPFEGQIIYDSLFTSYAVSFGPNIRHRLNDAYRNVQEREGIITSLLPVEPLSADEQRTQAEARMAKTVQAFRKHLMKAGLSPKMVEQHVGTIQTFAQTMLLSQVPPRALLETTPQEVQAFLRTTGSRTTATSFTRFVRFLSETGRVEYEQTEALRQVPKQTREKSPPD